MATMDEAIFTRSCEEPCSVPAGVYGIYFDTDKADAEYATCSGGYIEIYASGGTDLIDRWETFCEENGEDPSGIECVSLEQEPMDVLEDFLSSTGATLVASPTWMIINDTEAEPFGDYHEMLRYMHKKNTEV